MAAGTKNNKTKAARKPTKRHRVGIGDVVQYNSPTTHMTGEFGEVVHIIDDKHVVIKPIGSEQNDAYRHNLWVVATSKPRGTDKRINEKKAIFTLYIRRVMFRREEAAPEPVVVKPEPRVLSTPDELKEHLNSDSKEKVVYKPEKTS